MSDVAMVCVNSATPDTKVPGDLKSVANPLERATYTLSYRLHYQDPDIHKAMKFIVQGCSNPDMNICTLILFVRTYKIPRENISIYEHITLCGYLTNEIFQTNVPGGLPKFIAKRPNCKQNISVYQKGLERLFCNLHGCVRFPDDPTHLPKNFDITRTFTMKKIPGRNMKNLRFSESFILGSGAYGQVKRVRTSSNQDFHSFPPLTLACKSLRSFETSFLKDVTALQWLEHVKGVPDFYFSTFHEIFMECGALSMYSLLFKNGDFHITHRQILKWLYTIVCTMAQAHSMNLAHLDLKTSNLVVTSDMNVLVVDWGSSHAGDVTVTRQAYCSNTTRWSRAPEEFSKQVPYTVTTESIDVWSFGCVALEMLTGQIPFQSSLDTDTSVMMVARRHRVMNRIRQWPPFAAAAPYYDLFDKVFSIDPCQRPSFEQIKSHPMFDSQNL